MMIVYGATSSAGLAWEVAKKTRSGLGKLETKRFPDGEIYLRLLSKVKGKEVAVIRSARSSDEFMELFLLLDALKDNSASQVHAVIPYLGYTRQDKAFTDGEAQSAKTVLSILDELSDDITTVNCHFLDEAGNFTYKNVVIRNIDATVALTDFFKNKLKKPFVIAPDKGSTNYAKRAAEQMGCDFNHLEKKRLSGEEVVVRDKPLDVKGLDVLILDDIIATGGTIVEAAKVICGWKPSSINVGCVHGLFLSGLEPFKGVVDRIVSTNTLETQATKVSVADLIVSDLKSV